MILSRLVFVLFCLSACSGYNSGGKLSKTQKAMDVHHYDIRIEIDPYKKTISGIVGIKFSLKKKVKKIEIDLLKSYSVSNAFIDQMPMAFAKRGNKIIIEKKLFDVDAIYDLKLSYKGIPPVAKNPPWEGGVTWSQSEDGYPWVGLSCQHEGAYIWFPCKEHPSDKPDSVDIFITVPEPLKVASNGLLENIKEEKGRKETWHWKTRNPISTYNINFTIGNFDIITKRVPIRNEKVYMEYYVLPESRNGAEGLMNEAEKYLDFYTNIFGVYPWLNEKLGIVETPYLGMEHQTIIAYGNKYKKTKMGYDGLLFHEMGHEWWGNFLSVSDWSDFWIPEGFTTYAEALYIEENFGVTAYHAFMQNTCRKNIRNDKPLVGNKYATTDEIKGTEYYYKGAYVLHMLRYLVGYDVLLETLNDYLYTPKSNNNQTTTKEFIKLLEGNSKMELSWFFNQFVYSEKLPTLYSKSRSYKQGEKQFVEMWWAEPMFPLPVEVRYKGTYAKEKIQINIGDKPTGISIPSASVLEIDPQKWLLFNNKNFDDIEKN
tara:strand:+ start:150 stop:1772 length:1623 start_codon:yes stop_codon:yes gene_type:complete